eukprot:3587351-Rhodomonas_salina.1
MQPPFPSSAEFPLQRNAPDTLGQSVPDIAYQQHSPIPPYAKSVPDIAQRVAPEINTLASSSSIAPVGGTIRWAGENLRGSAPCCRETPHSPRKSTGCRSHNTPGQYRTPHSNRVDYYRTPHSNRVGP